MQLRRVLGAACCASGVRRAACLTCAPPSSRSFATALKGRAQSTGADDGEAEALAMATRQPDVTHIGSQGKRAQRRDRSRIATSRTLDFTNGGDPAARKEKKKVLEAMHRRGKLVDTLGVNLSLFDHREGDDALFDSDVISELRPSQWVESVIELARMSRPDLAVALMEARRELLASIEPRELGGIGVALCQCGELDLVHSLATELFLQREDFKIKARPSRLMGPLVVALLKMPGREKRAEAAAKMWSEAEGKCFSDESKEAAPPPSVFNGALKSARRAKSMRTVFHLLSAMWSAGSQGDDETFAEVSNAAARSVDFVKGAVSMETMPDADRGEALLMGRSNVGKSSLVNMLCNRKSLAFTSKKPGKTQEFNYFAVNSPSPKESLYPSKWDPPGMFYLVDVPGLGYAKMPASMRNQWRGLLEDYLTNRSTLQVVFHLVDARLDKVQEVDMDLIDLVKPILLEGRSDWQYVIVLTKADKLEKRRGSAEKLEQRIDKLKSTLLERLGPELSAGSRIPILVTSSVSRRGRDAMWHQLQRAALFNDPGTPKAQTTTPTTNDD